jgi:hypothetical protein
MANELTLVYETSLPVAFLCADAGAIEKGSLVKLSDPNTVAITAGDNDIIAGVTAEEKIANDGKTKIPVYRTGVFKGTAGTAGVTVGVAIVTDSATSAANKLADAAVNEENIVGISRETATAGETFLFDLNPVSMNLA